jgi:hypothetical protein
MRVYELLQNKEEAVINHVSCGCPWDQKQQGIEQCIKQNENYLHLPGLNKFTKAYLMSSSDGFKKNAKENSNHTLFQ